MKASERLNMRVTDEVKHKMELIKVLERKNSFNDVLEMLLETYEKAKESK